MHNMNRVQMLDFPQHGDARGHLVIVEGAKDIPFEIITNSSLYVNEEALAQFGLTLPADLAERAQAVSAD